MRFDISVEDILIMGILDPLADLDEVPEDLRVRKLDVRLLQTVALVLSGILLLDR